MLCAETVRKRAIIRKGQAGHFLAPRAATKADTNEKVSRKGAKTRRDPNRSRVHLDCLRLCTFRRCLFFRAFRVFRGPSTKYTKGTKKEDLRITRTLADARPCWPNHERTARGRRSDP